jgi:hypothetical protein
MPILAGTKLINPFNILRRRLRWIRDNLKATMNLAAVYFKKKDVDKAEAKFKEALEEASEGNRTSSWQLPLYAATGRLPKPSYLKGFDLAPADPRCLFACFFYMSAKKACRS